jgi:hypothetical protein
MILLSPTQLKRIAFFVACAFATSAPVYAQVFNAGDLVISVSGNGNNSGTYGDNQASPIVLDDVTTSGTIKSQLTLPQNNFTNSNGVLNYAISGEYGSSSEGSLQLSADGQSLVIAGYDVNAVTWNAATANASNSYGTQALAQTTSVLGGTNTAVARVIADVNANGTVDTSTALYGVFNVNNPRSVATVNGSSFYITGQGVKGDTTQGLFSAQDGASTATAINNSTDMRTAEIYNGRLYVSTDSKQTGATGTSKGSANIAVYGSSLPTSLGTPTVLTGISNNVTLTSSANGINAAGSVNLSPENFFFANADTMYVADGGAPKQGGLGDGGLQKWTFNGTSWKLDYTLSTGLNLVANTAASGTTGLIGLTGKVVGNQVELFTTNSTVGDLDQTYLYGINDSLSATALPTNESFTVLDTAAAGTNIRGVAFAPVSAVPEPNSYLMLLLGMGLLAWLARRKKA